MLFPIHHPTFKQEKLVDVFDLTGVLTYSSQKETINRFIPHNCLANWVFYVLVDNKEVYGKALSICSDQKKESSNKGKEDIKKEYTHFEPIKVTPACR